MEKKRGGEIKEKDMGTLMRVERGFMVKERQVGRKGVGPATRIEKKLKGSENLGYGSEKQKKRRVHLPHHESGAKHIQRETGTTTVELRKMTTKGSSGIRRKRKTKR